MEQKPGFDVSKNSSGVPYILFLIIFLIIWERFTMVQINFKGTSTIIKPLNFKILASAVAAAAVILL